jgi:hypothetical protein
MAFTWLSPKSRSYTAKFQTLDYITQSCIKPKANFSMTEKLLCSPTGFTDQSSKLKN